MKTCVELLIKAESIASKAVAEQVLQATRCDDDKRMEQDLTVPACIHDAGIWDQWPSWLCM